MKIESKSRNELKAYFRKNSIPTESNFADLINGMLNHKDDGIAKLPGNPLSIEADDSVQQKLINFYHDLEEEAPVWSLSLNPKSDPADASSDNNSGLSISDSLGNSHLFIESTTGNVGIGNITPKGKLDINGSLVFTGNSSTKISGASRGSRHALVLKGHWNELEIKGRVIDWTGTNLHIGYDNNHASHMIEMGRNVGHLRFMSGGGTTETMRVINGRVGIGTSNPMTTLHVGGSVKVDGFLNLSGQITQDNWKPASLINGWVRHSTTFNSAEYFRDSFGIVHLKGMVKNGTGEIFRLPAGYRPGKRELQVTFSNNAVGRIDIETNGRVTMQRGNNAWVSLDGITFRAVVFFPVVTPVVVTPITPVFL